MNMAVQRTLPVVSTGAGQLQALVPLPVPAGGHAGGPPIPIAGVNVPVAIGVTLVDGIALIQVSMTLHLVVGSPAITIKLLRDGVEQDVTDEYVQKLDGMVDFATVTAHWTDTPPVGAHTYTVTAIAVGGTAEALNRRITVVS